MSIKCCSWPAGPPQRPPLHHQLPPTALGAPSVANLAAVMPRSWEAPPSASSLEGSVEACLGWAFHCCLLAQVLVFAFCHLHQASAQGFPLHLQAGEEPAATTLQGLQQHNSNLLPGHLRDRWLDWVQTEDSHLPGCTGKTCQSGEFPNQVYFAESSLQF